MNANPLSREDPVSYTHLDVYKRQKQAYADKQAKKRAILKALREQQ